jgi:hypothetical protein
MMTKPSRLGGMNDKRNGGGDEQKVESESGDSSKAAVQHFPRRPGRGARPLESSTRLNESSRRLVLMPWQTVLKSPPKIFIRPRPHLIAEIEGG